MKKNDESTKKPVAQLKEQLPGVKSKKVEDPPNEEQLWKDLQLDDGNISLEGISAEERQSMLPQVKKAVGFLTNMEISEIVKAKNVDSIGKRSEKEKIQEAEFLDRKIKEFAKDSATKQIADGLLRIRDLADELNPDKFDLRNPKSLVGRWTRKTFGPNPVSKYLDKFESHTRIIGDITKGLKAGADRVKGNNMIFYDRKKRARELVQQLKNDVLFIRLTIQNLEVEMQQLDNPDLRIFLEQEIVPFLVERARALEELRAVKNTSIFNDELIIRMGRRAINSVHNMDTTIESLKTAVINNLAIIDLEKLTEAISETNLFASHLAVENAKRQGLLIENMSKEEAQGLIYDKLVEAYQITLDNLDNYQKAVAETTKRSKEKIEKLDDLNKQLEESTERMEKGSETLLSLKKGQQGDEMSELFQKWDIDI